METKMKPEEAGDRDRQANHEVEHEDEPVNIQCTNKKCKAWFDLMPSEMQKRVTCPFCEESMLIMDSLHPSLAAYDAEYTITVNDIRENKEE